MDESKLKINLFKSLIFISGVLFIFLITLVVSAALDINNQLKQTENTITVTATGEVYAKPDLAIVTFSTINEAQTVSEALSANTKKMNAVIAAVKEQGVEAKDLKTTNFNIYPRYEWYDERSYIYPQGERVLVGYEVNQSLEVKIRDLDKVGDIIQEATDAGANEVSNLQFTIDNQDEFKKQAREEAINEAKTKAKELASELGIKLIRISNFSESSVFPLYFETKAVGMGGGEEGVQVESGENKIEVTVYITYDIK